MSRVELTIPFQEAFKGKLSPKEDVKKDDLYGITVNVDNGCVFYHALNRRTKLIHHVGMAYKNTYGGKNFLHYGDGLENVLNTIYKQFKLKPELCEKLNKKLKKGSKSENIVTHHE